MRQDSSGNKKHNNNKAQRKAKSEEHGKRQDEREVSKDPENLSDPGPS